MNQIGSGFAVLALSATAAHAGGIDRSLLPYALLFEEGRVMELGFSTVSPSVSGVTPVGPGLATGNMAENYTTLTFALKGAINDRLDYMVVANQPYGADANYTTGAYTGLEAHWSSEQIAALLKYQVGERVSVYGGMRYVQSSANIIIPPALLGTTYTASTTNDGQVGYIAGVAYEIPAIAMRVGLTFESEITHSFDTTEAFVGGGGGATTTNITMPQSVALDFQTGVAKDTLVFGSVRWSEWSKWHVSPPIYTGAVGDEITGFDNDVVTWSLGVGRRINDNLSVFARLGYEAPNKDVASRLAPTDGMQSIGIGGSWTKDNIKVTGGVEYVKLGNATDASGTVFSGNSAIGLGVKVDFTF
jgi:long-chain fatty acid transport protein